MADNTSTTAAGMPDYAQQDCPLMKLPTELRLRIYKFAFDDIVDKMEADTANKKRMYEVANVIWPSPGSFPKAYHPIFVGVLGFLHISRELRCECLDALRAPTKAFRKVCSEHHKAAVEAFRIPVRDQDGNLWHSKDFLSIYCLRSMECDVAVYRLRRMDFICNAIALIVRNVGSRGRSSTAPSSKAFD